MTNGNLLAPEPTFLPPRDAEDARLADGEDPAAVVTDYPDFSAAWAKLAETALRSGETVAAYAYARTGYHRGLDQLRKHGWKGFGAVPWSHEPNQGFLRAVGALATAAKRIDEVDEYDRCRELLDECDPEAAKQLGL